MTEGLEKFATFLPGLIKSGSSILQTDDAINATISGGEIQADAYRAKGQQSYAIANYNISLERLQTDKEVNNLRRNVQQAIGRQRVQAAKSGLAGTSKSFLLVMNETMNGFDNAINQAQTNLTIKEDQIRFQAAQQAVDAENRARAVEFQTQIATFQQGVQQAEQTSGFITQLGGAASSLLGGLGKSSTTSTSSVPQNVDLPTPFSS